MDPKKAIQDFLFNRRIPNNSITFYKTQIIRFDPYETKEVMKIPITGKTLSDVYDEILKQEVNMEYSICLNEAKSGYDHKTNGFRLTYSIQNVRNTFLHDKKGPPLIFYSLGLLCDLSPYPNFPLVPSNVILFMAIILFSISDLPLVSDTVLKDIEMISILKKDIKTSIVFQTGECKNIKQLEEMIKKVFVLNSASIFSIKSFSK